MIQHNKITLVVTLLIILVLGACSSTPKEKTFGEKIVIQSEAEKAIGEKWSDGEQLIADGAELIEEGEEEIDDGESLISDGESKVREGESMMRKGNKMKAEAEETYRLRNNSSNLQ